MNEQFPKFRSKSFICPLCNVYANMFWENIKQLNIKQHIFIAKCDHCNNSSIWRAHYETPEVYSALMVYPDVTFPVIPAEDMPDDVKQDFLEARDVFNKSPKASAALLRLALQKLLIFLEEPGENINTDIKSLVQKGILSASIIKAADTVRITGNNAVHPGQMDDGDISYIGQNLFALINIIVNKTITEPKELDELYNRMPQGARDAIEKRDSPK